MGDAQCRTSYSPNNFPDVEIKLLSTVSHAKITKNIYKLWAKRPVYNTVVKANSSFLFLFVVLFLPVFEVVFVDPSDLDGNLHAPLILTRVLLFATKARKIKNPERWIYHNWSFVEVNQTSDAQSLNHNSGGSRPSDKGGMGVGDHPHPEIRGGPGVKKKKKFCPYFVLKIKGVGDGPFGLLSCIRHFIITSSIFLLCSYMG